MFILYAVPIGVVVGSLIGGRLRGLAELQFRLQFVMLAGLVIQVVLFADEVASWIGDAGALVYVASTTAVFVAVLANHRIIGMPIVAFGAGCNLAAIIANGGYMPADPGALAALGKITSTDYSNSAVLADVALAPLTDIFALPRWLPFANIFSVGDVLIGLGVVFVIAVAMRRGSMPAVPERRLGRVSP